MKNFQWKCKGNLRPIWNFGLGMWCLCAALLFHPNLYAQSEDFELWKGIELKKAWGKKLTFSFEEQVRLNKTSTFGTWLSLHYSIEVCESAIIHRFVLKIR